MNNAILFFFNINILEIKKLRDNYYFNYAYNDYIVYSYKRDVEEAVELYYLNLEFISNGYSGYEIILTKDRDILFLYEGNYYVLMRLPSIKNRIITYDDVVNFYYFPSFKIKKIDKSNWGSNWANKIDFIEYQFAQMKNKKKIIDSSIDYFIGIWENAVSYYNDNVNFVMDKVLCHKRITCDMDLLEFLNPMNFVIDYKERDVGDYLKSFVINNNFTFSSLDNYLYFSDRNRIILLIARILFPSYYFDMYEEIILDNYDEEDLISLIDSRNNVLFLIDYLIQKYINLNIPVIGWIKKEISLIN